MKLTRRFPAEAESVANARRFAAGLVTDGPPELRETIELMVSELATNCVRHVNASFEVSIEHDGDSYHVEVRDEGGGRPAMRSPSPEDVSGRGLRIVDLLAARWGVRYDADAGKTVWFTLTAPGAAAGQQIKARKTTGFSARPGGRADEALTR
ncbi:MAG TPA: ATP-binding protein [Solirubrobacteraceae bacterium]|nr:ATP-binding protein [Solirubrobacteraceae bacterium]